MVTSSEKQIGILDNVRKLLETVRFDENEDLVAEQITWSSSAKTQDGKFIQITVRHARTHIDDGKAQFTDYEIELKTNHIAFTLKNSKVRRRYSDFVWLRNRLMKDTMSAESPSLPGRRLFGRFNKDFIKQRQKKLQDFLFGLVQNNAYLSHAALHLFLQSKLTADEIDSYLDSNMDEDATETILAESEGKVHLDELLSSRDRVGSKHDSGISGDFGELETLNPNYDQCSSEEYKDTENETLTQDFDDNNNVDDDDDIFNDGHAADIESHDDLDCDPLDAKSDNEEEEDENIELTRRQRIDSLPAPTPEHLHGDRFESSVEYLLSDSSDSDTSKRSTRSSTKGSISDFRGRMSSQENVRTPKKRSKRRYSRQHSHARKSLFNSNVSLPEFHTDNYEDNSTAHAPSLRRCKSFYDYSNSSDGKTRQRRNTLQKQSSCNSDGRAPSGYGSQDFTRPRHLRRTTSSLSTPEKTPVRRKISLNEYIIVGRHSVFDIPTETEKEFKTSL